MKKFVALLLSLALVFTAGGCQNENTPSSGTESLVSQTEESPEDTVVLCIEDSFRTDANELLGYLSAIGVETKYELLVLPSNPEEREPELTRLRTEIMAGEGPDAFLLDLVPTAYVDVPESLFPNVEKSMYSHLFLDLEDMVQESDMVDLESCNQMVMDAGKTEEGRFLLPIQYTYPALAIEKSALSDPDFTFSSLEELLQSGEETLKGQAFYLTFLNPSSYFGRPADYAGQNLLFTQEEFQSYLEDYLTLMELSQGILEEGSPVVARGWIGRPFSAVSGSDCAFFPMINRTGGVTASVSLCAAINRNTNHPEEAFDFIELLLSQELQSSSGFQVNDRHYGSGFSFGSIGHGIPVKDSALQEFLFLSDEAADLVRQGNQRIDQVKFFSDLDWELYNFCDSYPRNAPAEMVEEWKSQIPQVFSTLEMILAE